jgi:hypothetical protein
MVWFDTDAQQHAAALTRAGHAVRALHAAASALLVLGALAHLGLRIRRASTARGMRTGALAFLAIAVAAASGAMIAQTAAAEEVLRMAGLSRLGSRATLLAAVLHIAYASLAAVLAVYFHVARWGLGALGTLTHRVLAVAAAAILALAWGASQPGSTASWSSVTSLVTPPVTVLWAWPLLVGVAAYAAARWLAARP